MANSEKILFHEEQQFRQYWLWALMTGIVLFSLAGIIMEARVNEEERRELHLSLGIILPLFALTFYLLYNSKLETEVTEKGIFYRWRPFFKKYNFISVDEIERVEVRKAPIGQYGFHLFPTYGRIHNVKGRDGLQFYLKSGRKIFLGTQDLFLFKKSVDRLISPKHKI